MFVYLNGEYIPEENAHISPNDRGFLFSDGIYEVIRSYDGTLFEPSAHLARLGYGVRALRLTETGFDYLPEVASELVRRNGLESGDATVYIQVTRGSAPRTHRFPPKDTPLTVYVSARRFNPHHSEQKQGELPQSWSRISGGPDVILRAQDFSRTSLPTSKPLMLGPSKPFLSGTAY